mmetsp:Transcript_12458/g.29329  ORF Transcript_12458/g.29329 Transcript_12458/m.29329 type:complete len:245 (+) Transcript_12458:307-1041(+)
MEKVLTPHVRASTDEFRCASTYRATCNCLSLSNRLQTKICLPHLSAHPGAPPRGIWRPRRPPIASARCTGKGWAAIPTGRRGANIGSTRAWRRRRPPSPCGGCSRSRSSSSSSSRRVARRPPPPPQQQPRTLEPRTLGLWRRLRTLGPWKLALRALGHRSLGPLTLGPWTLALRTLGSRTLAQLWRRRRVDRQNAKSVAGTRRGERRVELCWSPRELWRGPEAPWCRFRAMRPQCLVRRWGCPP